MCAVSVLFFASCQTADSKDANGDTPSAVVEKMYQAIQAQDFATAVSYNKIPDTVKIKLEKEGNIYEQFQGCPTDKDGKVIVTGDEWKAFLMEKMQMQSEGYTLDSWEILSEEVSNTDPNAAKVKTRIHLTREGVKSETDCSFPMKRENGIWLIIG